jgi:hypothetical protein
LVAYPLMCCSANPFVLSVAYCINARFHPLVPVLYPSPDLSPCTPCDSSQLRVSLVVLVLSHLVICKFGHLAPLNLTRESRCLSSQLLVSFGILVLSRLVICGRIALCDRPRHFRIWKAGLGMANGA